MSKVPASVTSFLAASSLALSAVLSISNAPASATIFLAVSSFALSEVLSISNAAISVASFLSAARSWLRLAGILMSLILSVCVLMAGNVSVCVLMSLISCPNVAGMLKPAMAAVSALMAARSAVVSTGRLSVLVFMALSSAAVSSGRPSVLVLMAVAVTRRLSILSVWILMGGKSFWRI